MGVWTESMSPGHFFEWTSKSAIYSEIFAKTANLGVISYPGVLSTILNTSPNDPLSLSNPPRYLLMLP